MSVKRDNSSLAESIKNENGHSPAASAEGPSTISNQDPDLSLIDSSSSETSHASQDPAPIIASQMDEIITLDSLPTPPMDAICRYLLDAEDYEALANLRKTNRACKAGVDSFFNQKKNIPPMESIAVRLTNFVLEFKLDVHKDTLSFRPHLKELKNHVHNGTPKMFSFKASYSIFRFVVQRIFRGYEVLGTIKKVVGNVRVLSVDLGSLEHLRFLDRELIESTAKFDKLMLVWNERHDDLKLNDEFSTELDSMIASRSIGALEINFLTGEEPPYELADPIGFFERLTRLMKEVTLSEHSEKRQPLLFGLSHKQWKTLIPRLEKNGARAHFYTYRGVLRGGSTHRTMITYQAHGDE